jgi:hypothetical protein
MIIIRHAGHAHLKLFNKVNLKINSSELESL